MDEREIWAVAKMAVARFGDGAAFHAASRSDELLDRGDTEGAAVWRRIMAAIEFLQSPERPV